MTTQYEILETRHDEHGRHYKLGNESPLQEITINEADGTVTIHDTHDSEEDLEDVLQDLFAIERDRLLDYSIGEFHMAPAQAVQNAWSVLTKRGYDAEELIQPDDQESLKHHYGIRLPQQAGFPTEETSNNVWIVIEDGFGSSQIRRAFDNLEAANAYVDDPHNAGHLFTEQVSVDSRYEVNNDR